MTHRVKITGNKDACREQDSKPLTKKIAHLGQRQNTDPLKKKRVYRLFLFFKLILFLGQVSCGPHKGVSQIPAPNGLHYSGKYEP